MYSGRESLIGEPVVEHVDHSSHSMVTAHYANLHLLDSASQVPSSLSYRSFEHCLDSAGINLAVVEVRVAAMIKERRNRAAFFSNQHFSDPAWEILLALALAHARHQRLDVSKLCRRVDATRTTAIRWIHSMTANGTLICHDDVHDLRRRFVSLSQEAWQKMGAYLGAIEPIRACASGRQFSDTTNYSIATAAPF